mmetsp:Transcript_38670/g.99288  ORF Transcript_38670/g.99288 Transcript_38670/m.99288 type:complete len:107 (-) Transcript_38670:69-389(-)
MTTTQTAPSTYRLQQLATSKEQRRRIGRQRAEQHKGSSSSTSAPCRVIEQRRATYTAQCWIFPSFSFKGLEVETLPLETLLGSEESKAIKDITIYRAKVSKTKKNK